MWMRTQKRDRCKVILLRHWRPLLKRWRLPRGDKLNESKKASQCPNLMNSATLNWRKYHQINQRDSPVLRTNFVNASQRKLSHKLHVLIDLRCSELLSLMHRTRRKACTLKIQNLLFLTSERRVQTEVTFSLKAGACKTYFEKIRTQISDKEVVNDCTIVWWSDYVLWP